MPARNVKRTKATTRSKPAPAPVPPRAPAYAGDIDPQLLEQLAQASPRDQVEAVILVADAAPKDKAKTMMDAGAGQEERGPGGALVDRVKEAVGDEPSAVRYMPRLGVVVVKGSPRLIRGLIQDPAVVSATVSK